MPARQQFTLARSSAGAVRLCCVSDLVGVFFYGMDTWTAAGDQVGDISD